MNRALRFSRKCATPSLKSAVPKLCSISWLAITVAAFLFVPSLEKVEKDHPVAMDMSVAPSIQAMQRMSEMFQKSDSNAVAMIVIEGQQPLGPDARQYYDDIVDKLEADPTHVEHVQDFWGDSLTEAAAQSTDGKAVYAQVFLATPDGAASANKSVQAVRDIVDSTPAPAGVDWKAGMTCS